MVAIDYQKILLLFSLFFTGQMAPWLFKWLPLTTKKYYYLLDRRPHIIIIYCNFYWADGATVISSPPRHLRGHNSGTTYRKAYKLHRNYLYINHNIPWTFHRNRFGGSWVIKFIQNVQWFMIWYIDYLYGTYYQLLWSKMLYFVYYTNTIYILLFLLFAYRLSTAAKSNIKYLSMHFE